MKLVRIYLIVVSFFLFTSGCKKTDFQDNNKNTTLITSSITESYNINDVLKYAKKGDVVVFDIDSTLFRSYLTDEFGKNIDLNFGAIINFMTTKALETHKSNILKNLYRTGINQKIEPELVKLLKKLIFKVIEKKLFHYDSHIYKQVHIKVVDKQTANVIRKLQDKSIATMVFTARDWFQINNTEKELLSQNIRMNKNTVFHKEIINPTCDKTHGFGFKNGILLLIPCKNLEKKNEKGPVLLKFFDAINYKPQKVVFVDNSKTNVNSVLAALKKKTISVQCLWFRACEYKKDAILSNKFIQTLNKSWGNDWWKIDINTKKTASTILEHLKKKYGRHIIKCHTENQTKNRQQQLY